MLISPKKIPAGPVIRVFLIFLTAAILLWGLQAKLALYKPASPARTISAAKLTPNKHQILYIARKELTSSGRRMAIDSCVGLKVVFAGSATLPTRNRRIGEPVLSPISLSEVPFFARPPPSVA
jgi:hypothetical protein